MKQDDNKTIEQLKFEYVCDEVVHSERVMDGIGTLSEKTLHAVVKKFYEINEKYHEIKIGRNVADICSMGNSSSMYDTDIVEIQTANFNKLRKKLDYFLKEYTVTIVYPLPHIKNISWIDTDTGEISKGRKSPKKGNRYMVFKELYKIKDYLDNPNLKIHILLIDVDEYRLLNGWSEDKKRGSCRNERIPVALHDLIRIDELSDYLEFIPEIEKEEFTSNDYAKYGKISIASARVALNILTHIGAVERVGKKGNTIIYRKNDR